MSSWALSDAFKSGVTYMSLGLNVLSWIILKTKKNNIMSDKTLLHLFYGMVA